MYQGDEMSKTGFMLALLISIVGAKEAASQVIREYTVKRAAGIMVIDGRLDEPEWKEAAFTEDFVLYKDGAAPKYPSQGQMLWDDTYLYIAFTMSDADVSGKTVNWVSWEENGCLCNEEVAEVFIDPDDDRLMYMEIEINPFGALMDLWVDKALKDGGEAEFDWKFEGIVIGVSVNGTLNTLSDTDTNWICELALPFTTMEFTSSTANFPPKNGDSWRINLYRYDYDRTGTWHNELTGWNQTGTTGGFHVPERFGRIIFSMETVGSATEVEAVSPLPFALTGNYPNPFNPSTTIDFSLHETGFTELTIYNLSGQKIRELVSGTLSSGHHSVVWNGLNDSGFPVSAGLYLSRLTMGDAVTTGRMMLVK
jgi:cellulose/xylan binding protein with CBM9 domain/flagellar hook capping protein FlgD